MKKIFSIPVILVGLIVLTFSSCLKDKTYIDLSKGGTTVDFPLGGMYNFSSDAITETPDTDANGTIVRQFAVNVASVNVPTTPTTLTLTVGNAASVAAFNAANPAVIYELLPANAYKFTTTTITIPSGQQYATTSITFYKNLLDPSKSYMLPVTITKTTNGTIASNLSTHYFHFIGNDFAGSYEEYYDRWKTPDTTIAANHDNVHVDLGPITFYPVTPTEFTVTTGYYTQPPYDVTFTKTGSGASATYSNFQAVFTADVIAAYFTPNVTLATQPVIVPQNNVKYDPTKQYTFAEALKLMRFYYTTATRAVIDTYVKQ